MDLTPVQITALAADIAADGTLNQVPHTADGAITIANAYNAPSSPVVSIWIPNIPVSTLLTDFLVADMSALPAADLAYLQMLLDVGTVDATNANVRTNFNSIFSGKTTLTNLTATAQRTATRFEALAVNITAAVPANVCSVYGYVLSSTDVRQAMGF